MSDDQMQPPRGLGALPDVPDERDHVYQPRFLRAGLRAAPKLPLRRSLSRQMPPIWDQGYLGSCTAQAAAAVYQHAVRAQMLTTAGRKTVQTPSRLQIYRNGRMLLDPSLVDQDSGATMRTAIKGLVKMGACPERLWTYSDAGNKFALEPDIACLEISDRAQAVEYLRLDEQDDTELVRTGERKEALSNAIRASIVEMYPVGFGIYLYASFRPDPKTGRIPEPKPGDAEWGGHAMTIIGYDFSGRVDYYLVRNSWSDDWGGEVRTRSGTVSRNLRGHAWIPANWIESQGWDFWVIRRVEESD